MEPLIMVILVNPNLVVQSDDLFTTGIVYMPIGLAEFAGALRQGGIDCYVIDAFGERPSQCWAEASFLIRGLRPSEVVAKMGSDACVVVVYAMNLACHRSLVSIIKAVRRAYPAAKLAVLENTQAVTAYSLRRIQEEFYDLGVDYVITGEGEDRGRLLIGAILSCATAETIAAIDGVGFRRPEGGAHYTPPVAKIANLDSLPLPAWDLFPLENYWSLKYAHGPFQTRRYLPLLTSRGCPYPCRFCVIPETNDQRWRAKSAKHLVDEIEELVNRFGVREYHIEDVNPTVSDRRTREFCEELLRRKIDVIWKLCSGTKVETMKDESTVELMAKAGCRYISISPESGSPRVMKLINKPFKIDHAIKLVRTMSRVGIRSQACFVLGFPGEEDADREMTRTMVRELTRVGVDEIALFVITPVPGSAIFSEFARVEDYSKLNFSPSWRSDYEKLNSFRLGLYREFLLWKMLYHPLNLLRQTFCFFARRFETKMEMTPYRALHTAFLRRSAEPSAART